MMSDPIYQIMAVNQAIHQGALKQQEILLPSVQTIPLRQNISDVNTKAIDITAIEIKEDIAAIETVQEQIAKINKTINEETKKLLTGGTPTNPDFNVKELSKLGTSLLIPKEDGVGFYGATDLRKMKREGMIDFISQNIQPDALKEIIANRGKPLRKFDNADIAKYKEALDTRLREMIKNAQSFEDIENIQSTALTLISSIQQTKVLANVNPNQIRQLSGYESQFKKLTNLEGIKFEAKGMGVELPETISKHWDKTIDHISGKMEDLEEKSAEVGYDVQHELAEGSPGLTQRIRDYWDKTVKHIQGKIGELNNSDTSNLEPKSGLFENLRTQFPIVDQGIEKLRTLKSTIVTLGAAGLGIIGLVLIGKQLSNIAIESVKVYRNFESIFIASKMIKNGDQFLGDVRKQVKALGGDLESTMRQGQQFVTGLQGTNLERNASSMFLDSSKALKSLGLQNQQYDAAILALKQTASKGRVSLEEVSGQLGESVPGALNIAAQAMQTNVQGFIQMVESGNLLSEEFLPKFIAKLKSQTAFLEPEIKKSLNASLGRLGASQTELQVGIGAAISPAIIPTIDLISKGLNLINDNMDKAVITAQILAVALAMPAANQGILLIGKAWQFVTANMIVAKTAADAVNQSLMIGKTLLTGGAYIGAAMAITSVIQGAMYLMEGGSKNIKDLNDVIDSSSNAMADNYARAYGFAEKL
jgi:tape measure domain-containing protein